MRRVAQRVKQGGHNVPEDSIVRRYFAGIRNLKLHYLPLADEALVINNSLEEEISKRVIARKDKDSVIDIQDKGLWKKIERIANER